MAAGAGTCKLCRLHEKRTRVVFASGDPYSELVFVGEGPGADEDASGEPFVGASGRLLNKMIEAMGYQRPEVYVCNVVKCRPPGKYRSVGIVPRMHLDPVVAASFGDVQPPPKQLDLFGGF